MEGRAIVGFLRAEMARIRDLTAECRKVGVFLEDMPEELHQGRTLLQERQLYAALAHLRGIRVELLGRLLLKDFEQVPPLPVENAPAGSSPSPEALAAINARIDEILAAAGIEAAPEATEADST